MATFTGTSGSDTLTGGAGDDLIDGLGGADSLIGAAGIDTINGGGGNDTINGGLGNDVLDGGLNAAGSPDFVTYQTASGAVTVNLAAGTATGADGSDILSGFEGVRGSDFGDTLTGDSGQNFLRGGLGNDTLDGGAGSSDYAQYQEASGSVTVNLATGTSSGADGADTLIRIENIRGSNFGDTLTGDAGDNFLRGGLGNDTLDGGAGADTADYNNATASVTVNLSTGISSGADGNDTLSNMEGIRGGGFNDTLTGNSGSNSLQGGDGDDILRQTAGTDTLDGGAGSDRIEFTQTGITYSGATGVTVNLATHVSDLDNSAAGANATLVSIESVFGTTGNDAFTGGDATHAPDFLGNSTTENFRPSGGNDTITGAIGNGFFTRVDYANSTSAVTVNLGTGTASDGFGGTDTLVRVDNVFGGSGNDVLNGGGLERAVSGGFFEQFRGNSGNDTINGAGTDTVLGAAGSDRANYGNSPAAVIVNLGTTPYVVGSDTVPGGAARDGFGFTDTLLNINQVTGSAFNDTLVGGADDHRLIGDAGNDTLVGGANGVEASYQNATSAAIANLATSTASDGQGGTDTLVNITDLRGSDFNDTLTGNSADNRLAGEPGADTIDGGAGFDLADYSSTPLANGGINAFIENGSGAVGDGLGSTDTLTNIEGLVGSHANDTLAGGLGVQAFIGRGGSDSINGGAGNDWVSYSGDPAGVTVNLGTGSATDGWGGVWALGGTDTLISIENADGSDFADSLVGSAGANELRGAGGNDTLDGGAGIDTAVFDGARVDYTGSGSASGIEVVDLTGADGTDLLTGIERFQFADKNLAIDLGTGQAAGNTVRIIGAAFDAPTIQQHPDWVGIGLELFDSGMSMLQVCELVIGVLGFPSNETFVTTVYENVVGVAPSAGERDLYVGLLVGSGGGMTQAELLVLAANTEVNAQNIDLVGLQQTGVEFV